MAIPVGRLLPATIVIATTLLGFKVVALATTSSAALPSAAAVDAAPYRRSSTLVVAEPSGGGRDPAPPRPALAVPPPPPQAVSVQGVAQRGAIAPPGQPRVAATPPGGQAQAAPAQPAPVQLAVPADAPAAAAPAPSRLDLGADAPLPPRAAVPVEAAAGPDALKVRRSQVEERERSLVEREAIAAAAERRLSERVAELTVLQARLQALETGLKERDEANWSGMVRTYEAMRPKDAAAIFNDLDKPVLIEIADRMKPAKATLVFAAMNPEKARQLTADLAARRTRSTTVPN